MDRATGPDPPAGPDIQEGARRSAARCYSRPSSTRNRVRRECGQGVDLVLALRRPKISRKYSGDPFDPVPAGKGPSMHANMALCEGVTRGLSLGPSSRPVFPPHVPVRAARRSRSGMRVRRPSPAPASRSALLCVSIFPDGDNVEPGNPPRRRVPCSVERWVWTQCGLCIAARTRISIHGFCRSVDFRAQRMPISVLGLWSGGQSCLRRVDEGVLAISGRLKSEWCPVLTFVECHGIFYLAIL